MGRRSVWSDPRLIEAAARFVPTADEVWRLQTGEDADCLVFQALANRGHYRRAGDTRQGIYVCTPRGELLGSLNSNDPDAVLRAIDEAWAVWEALSPTERGGAGQRVAPERRWEDLFPADGLVLRSTARDLPDGRRGERWNRDHVWYSRDEGRGFVPPEPRVGAEAAVPQALVRRLARFHLVDHVRGQTIPYADGEVERAELTVAVEARDGDALRLALRGATRAFADGTWRMGDNDFRPPPDRRYAHGMSAALVGSAVYDLARERFLSFELVARAVRSGRTVNNGRGADEGSSALGFALSLVPPESAPPGGARRVAPAFVEVYDAPWLPRGGRRTATAPPAPEDDP